MFVTVGRFLVTAVAVGALASSAQSAAVEEIVVSVASSGRLPESGQYTAQHTVSGSFEGIDLVDGVAAAKLEFDVEVTNEDGVGFLHGAKGHCIGTALYQTDGPTGSGVCSFKDPDGDVLFMRFSEDPYTSTGTAESTGGTGKYANLEVKQTHRTLESDQLEGTRFEATGVRSGFWRTATH